MVNTYRQIPRQETKEKQCNEAKCKNCARANLQQVFDAKLVGVQRGLEIRETEMGEQLAEHGV